MLVYNNQFRGVINVSTREEGIKKEEWNAEKYMKIKKG